MANKKNDKGLGLQQTKGSFQIKGVVTGVDKDKFFSEIMTSTNKPMRMINVGVEVEKGKVIYINLNGMEKKSVFFSKSEGKGKDRKTTVKEVSWENRNLFKEEGYKLIGVNLGLTKVIDKTGKEVNDKKTLAEYDACDYINKYMKDGMSVFVRGQNEYSTYNDKHYTKFIPQQISLCKEIDFDDEEYTPISDFEQNIIFMGIEKNEDDNFTVSAKIVTYNSIEDAEFIIDKNNARFAKTLKKLKPYTALKVYGNIVVEHDVEQIEEDEDDGWGEPNPMSKINNPTKRIMLIVGGDKDSVDTETYSEEEIEKAISKSKAAENAKKDFGDDDDWGTVSDKDITDEDEEW